MYLKQKAKPFYSGPTTGQYFSVCGVEMGHIPGVGLPSVAKQNEKSKQ